ncbi:unnamed protein product [Prorocentrum cordatum]|uniref:Mannosyltransferase n=1 Tax=Prorocentrum cordatum TaxID=2364126 RepID=A0ABN9TFD5_9DINO|nr:unnamed protein product [Polarella glacialis]
MVDNYPLELVSDFFKVILGNFFRSGQPDRAHLPFLQATAGHPPCGQRHQGGVNCPAPPFGAAKEIGGQRFDVVVIATEANCVSKVLPREWTTIFDEFQYHPSHIFVHRDPSLMPEQKSE